MKEGTAALLLSDIKRLEGWTTTKEAMPLLGVTKQGIYKILEGGAFDLSDLRHIDEGASVRYLIRTEALEAYLLVRKASAVETAKRRKEKEHQAFLHDVRSWARAQGMVVRNDRPVPPALIRRYRKHLRELAEQGQNA